MATKRKRKGVNPRTKGGAFERNIKNDMSDWTGVTFTRTLGSGAHEQKGDVTPAHNIWKFCCELKHVEAWDFEHLFTGKGPIAKWWPKICQEAKDSGKLPLLIIKRNRKVPLACLSRQGMKLLFNKYIPSIPGGVHTVGDQNFIMYSELLKTNGKKTIEK